MKKFLVLLVALSIMITSMPVFAAQGRKGASDQALDKASDEAVFNRIGDWFATVGKSDSEKKAVLAERKTKRTAERAQKQAEKKKREMKKQAKVAQKNMQKQSRNLKKGMTNR
jgi:hypothetical protein